MAVGVPKGSVFFSVFWTALVIFTANPSTCEAQATHFQGRVFEGEVGNESVPLEGVEVSLYGANNPYPDLGTFIRSTTTNGDGWYQLEIEDGFEFYHIIESTPEGYQSRGATSVDGEVRTEDWIEYAIPLDDKTVTGNKFWDVPDQQPEFTLQGRVLNPPHDPVWRRLSGRQGNSTDPPPFRISRPPGDHG